jgi:hypothetical protein
LEVQGSNDLLKVSERERLLLRVGRALFEHLVAHFGYLGVGQGVASDATQILVQVFLGNNPVL